MKIKLLKNVGRYGVVLGQKTFITGGHVCIEMDGGESGTLAINERPFNVVDTKVCIPEYLIMPGPNKVTFTDGSGTYNCGTINKNGRFITASCPPDELIIACADALEQQAQRTDKLEKRLSALEKQYGITII
jgi:hypothetical protein